MRRVPPNLSVHAPQESDVSQYIGLVALIVRDYDEAIRYYVDVLGFELIEDTDLPEQDKRWVVVAPTGSKESRLLLARAIDGEQQRRVGNQTGGRVFLFLYTDDFWRDYSSLAKRGVDLAGHKPSFIMSSYK